MPRVGLNTSVVVAAGADLADEVGIDAVSLAALAERLGVKPPALYKHVNGLGDLRHRIATLAMTEMGDALRDALQGKSGTDAIRALFTTLQSYIAVHPGRYHATVGAQFRDLDDPLLAAATRVIDSLRAVLSSYGIPPDELDHAVRMLRCVVHGYVLLQTDNGFQWGNDPDASLTWMIGTIDAGLAEAGRQSPLTGQSRSGVSSGPEVVAEQQWVTNEL